MTTLTAKGIDGQVAFDGEWLEITRSGWIAVTLKGGRGEVRLHVRQITGIEYKKPGFSNGRFVVVAGGGVERSIGRRAHQSDPLAVEFGPRHADAFLAIRRAVETAISAGATGAAGGGDVAAQLAKLGEMYQQGLLTAEEFAAAKANLIHG